MSKMFETNSEYEKTNLDGLVISASYYTKLLIRGGECKIIYSTNMSINLNISESTVIMHVRKSNSLNNKVHTLAQLSIIYIPLSAALHRHHHGKNIFVQCALSMQLLLLEQRGPIRKVPLHPQSIS